MMMSEIRAILVVAVIAAVPLTFVARSLAAIFSEQSRFKLKDKPIAHVVWGILSVLAVGYFVIGFTLVHRKAEDHQRRIAEQGHAAYSE